MSAPQGVPPDIAALRARVMTDAVATGPEVETLLADASASGDAVTAAWAKLLLGHVGVIQSEAGAALAHLARSAHDFERLGVEAGVQEAFALLVNAWCMVGDLSTARLMAGRALRLARRRRDRAAEARVLVNLAYTQGEGGDAVAYEALTGQALAIFQLLGDHKAEAHALVNLGDAQVRTGQLSAARESYERARRLCTRGAWPYIEALLWCGRAGLALALGDEDAAEPLHRESLRRLEDIGRTYQHAAEVVHHAVTLAARRPTPERTRALHAAAELAQAHGFHGLSAQALAAEAALRRAEGDALGAAALEAAAETAREAAARELEARRARAAEAARLAHSLVDPSAQSAETLP